VTGFDLPCLEYVFGWTFRPHDVFDTRSVASKMFLDVGSHSLKAWGERLGCNKGDFGQSTDWSKFSPQMLAYCEQDVKVTVALYRHLKDAIDSQVPLDKGG